MNLLKKKQVFLLCFSALLHDHFDACKIFQTMAATLISFLKIS